MDRACGVWILRALIDSSCGESRRLAGGLSAVIWGTLWGKGFNVGFVAAN